MPLLIFPPPLLVRLTRPVPSGRTVKTFEEMPGTSPNPGLEKAIREPSGDQSIFSASPPFCQGVTCFSAPPVALVVNGPASPAPLVRLLAPSVLVLQTSDGASLDALHRATGPAVGALLPEGCAELLHDPQAGARLDERLTVTRPAAKGKGEALGWRSARQALDEIAQLDALIEVCRAARDIAVVVRPPANQQGATDGVEVVASWLLAQAGFPGGAA